MLFILVSLGMKFLIRTGSNQANDMLLLTFYDTGFKHSARFCPTSILHVA